MVDEMYQKATNNTAVKATLAMFGVKPEAIRDDLKGMLAGSTKEALTTRPSHDVKPTSKFPKL